MSQNYPPQQYPVNNTSANLMNPYQYPPPPLIVASPNQIKNAAKNMESNIIVHQDKLYHKQEKDHLKEKIEDLRFKNLEDKIDNLNQVNRTQTGGPIIVNVQQQQQTTTATETKVVIVNTRLKYSSGYFCLFLCLNIFFPGVGTMVAACLFGNTSDIGDRTGEIICHGVVQLLCTFFIFGWIWAILDAVRYFEGGRGCC